MANTRIALYKGFHPEEAPVQPIASVKRISRSTDDILSKLQSVLTEFFTIEELESYYVDTITFDDDITSRVLGNSARMDIRVVSLIPEGGKS